MKVLKLIIIVALSICSSTFLFSQPVVRGDSVQVILSRLARIQSDAAAYIPETKRYYLLLTPEEIPENVLESIQHAFYYDVSAFCKYYGWKYLLDWRVLASKAARETYWGTSYLSNRTFNYFGILSTGKPWACSTFKYCQTYTKNDPEPAPFVIFPNFEGSLWMFIHTIYSNHYLERLPDKGNKVKASIQHERETGVHYWQFPRKGNFFADQLMGNTYAAEEIIHTWSEHPINNLCVNCNRATDKIWVERVQTIAKSAKE
jgi:hypothetical protein